MKIEQIIDKLCSHELSKTEAHERINEIINGMRNNNAIQFDVEDVSFSLPDNHGFLKLKIPFQYSEIENLINKGDKVDVVVLF